ncbi:MAG: gliding motility lipoprotein GldD [Bacteroidales bacterium]|jgi:gliding motility-associated lipoprotein GldD|nr:gliding motility lipoprotein GldD [Bacteroidales bacterium]
MNKNYIFFLFFLIIICVCSCNSKQNPKPKGYFRIDFPQKTYQKYKSKNFSFNYPKYSYLYNDDKNPNWYYIFTPQNKATIYITYKKIDKNSPLDTLIESSHEFVYKHTIKADAITETKYFNDSLRVFGILYDIKGNTASSLQFFVTDSTKHFLRGSLYFECSPNKDSLAPVIDFFREDIVKLMETFSWE